MNETQQAQADLAFMRSLVGEAQHTQMGGGIAFLAAGLLYAVQCLVVWAQLGGLVHLSDAVMNTFIVGVTVVFLTLLFAVLWHGRKTTTSAVGTRALNGAFGGAGLANLVLSLVFGMVSVREGNGRIWLLYPVTLCVVLGAAWYVVFIIRRRVWVALVSVGWYLSAGWLAYLVGDAREYLLVLSAALLLLMALPGAAMMRAARPPA